MADRLLLISIPYLVAFAALSGIAAFFLATLGWPPWLAVVVAIAIGGALVWLWGWAFDRSRQALSPRRRRWWED